MNKLFVKYRNKDCVETLYLHVFLGYIEAETSASEFPEWFKRFLVNPKAGTPQVVNIIRLLAEAWDLTIMLNKINEWGRFKKITNWPEDWPRPYCWNKNYKMWDEDHQMVRDV